jgi:hypothetical protein
VDPVPDPLLLRKTGRAGNRTQTSGSVARNGDYEDYFFFWSSGQSSWLQNGNVLFPVRYELNLYTYIYIYYVEESRPPLWSSGQSSWLQIQTFGFDSRRSLIFREAVVLERGPLSLVSTIEELL